MKTINTLTPWSPSGDLNNIGRGFMDFFSNTPSTTGWGNTGSSSYWAPEVDVVEDEKEYRLSADLPEVRKEDLHVSYQNGTVELHGERVSKENKDNLIYHRSERSYGKFGRAFRLPDGVEGEKTRAKFRDGALLIHIPKMETEEIPKKEIPIGS